MIYGINLYLRGVGFDGSERFPSRPEWENRIRELRNKGYYVQKKSDIYGYCLMTRIVPGEGSP